MIMFDIGANRGDATVVALALGYKVIALEPAPRVYGELVSNFIYEPNVIPLRMAVSNKDNERIMFYEADEDGLSTMNKNWLTADGMPYKGKPYRTIEVNTITLDTLADKYGEPNLIKIDVEGAEWSVFYGMTRKMGKLAFEWTLETLTDHEDQLDYLYKLGYRSVAPQYIESHLQEPIQWYDLKANNKKQLLAWHQETSDDWIEGGWQESALRPTADVGMLWVC